MTTTQRDKIGKLYQQMYEFLLSYALSYMENRPLAEEAIQETFRIACMKPEALLESPNPKGWLINTLKNTMRNMERKRVNANKLLIAYTAAHGSSVAFSEDKLRMEISYSNVADSEEFKLIMEMAVDGRSHLEMAEARGISVDACKKRVQRAKEFLRKKI